MRVVIVDDEPLAREQLQRALEEAPDVMVVGEAGNGSEALEKIEEEKPDVVVLDIEMPGLNGLEVAEQLNKTPLVVFVTAYDEYAVKAFETHAVDYLLKPLDAQRLGKAVERLREQLRSQAAAPVKGLVASMRRDQ